ncbi:hypothetical protein CXG81DRAFT_28697 [Caulochytrium protostelioides]|uniref:Uncharacterized protein n=1 Tax=Caulochytrium protostelioides TaxID=1555241 RepID=A0A4P9X143_9FUNG|nr:hypothetical protein CXG81DRAFT_28697 [Caulochytrium protostelioides]|eukprot:RKO98478.1 hypothetical protein CXG81DRAFT_28697 [Caulochytrium protostelioides]
MADAESVSGASSDDSVSVVRVSAKRRRPDRAEKLKERKNQTETMVKAALLNITLSGLLKRCLDGVEDVMDALLPDLTNLNFYKQLKLGVAGTAKPKPHIRDYQLLAARLPTQRHLSDNNIYTASAFKYQANLRNHYQLSFEARVKKYLHVFQKADGLTDPPPSDGPCL